VDRDGNRVKERPGVSLVIGGGDLGHGLLAHVTAGGGPLIVLLQEKDAHQAEQTALVGEEIPTTLVRRAIFSFSRSKGLVEPSFRLAGALLLEQNDEWLVGRHYLSVESLTQLYDTINTEAHGERLAFINAGKLFVNTSLLEMHPIC
jgi:hypothetical protein